MSVKIDKHIGLRLGDKKSEVAPTYSFLGLLGSKV